MTYQKLLEAKIKLAEVDATTAMIVGGVIVFICAVLLMIGIIRSLGDSFDDASFICSITGGIGGFIGVVILSCGIYENATVRLRAEADMANYNLVEIAK